MCGIAGILVRDGAPPPTRESLAAMAGALRHRGPDALGMFRSAHVGFAHTRLAIIDPERGQQPLGNEDGSLWVVFNGEIFNYVELRDELVALGHRFRTASDTEVVVHAYAAWGNEAFARFNGQFAIALWNEPERTLVLARDRLGVRPLYVCAHGGRVFFASEVKAIFAADRTIPRELDPDGIDQTFTFWSVVPPQSVFRGVEELPPGHVRTYRRGDVREEAYWRPRYPIDHAGEFGGTIDDAAHAVREALEQAVRLRMLRADVPVGSYLSGGLDSSLVTALAREVKGARFSTFSLRFEDQEYDETAHQRAMVERLETDHHEITISRRDIANVFPEVIAHAERPILRTAPAPLFVLSRLVREAGVKVVLTGEGADEMFAGYDLFREAKIRRFWARAPQSTLRPRLLERLYPYLARSPTARQAMTRQFFGRNLAGAHSPGFSHEPRWQTTSALKRLFSEPLRRSLEGRDCRAALLATTPPEFARWSPLSRDQYLEVRTLLAGYLLSSQGDRMLMANSVEGRFPFLDVDVVALASSLPPEYKLFGLEEKHVLKRSSAGLVPQSIARRPKQPYRAPDALSFVSSDAPPWVAEAMAPATVADVGIFDPRAVAALWNKCRAAEAAQFSNTDNMAVVGVLSTHLLHRRLVAEVPAPPAVAFETSIDWVDGP